MSYRSSAELRYLGQVAQLTAAGSLARAGIMFGHFKILLYKLKEQDEWRDVEVQMINRDHS